MEQLTLPVISECVVAYDLDKQQHLTIGPYLGELAGFKQGTSISVQDFWLQLVHPADLERVNASYQQITINNSLDISYRLVHGNTGETRYISERRNMYYDGATGSRIVMSIINEHTGDASLSVAGQTEEDALKREQFLLSLINSQTNFLIRLDNKGHFTFVNRRYCQVFGYCSEELLGQHFSINTAPEDMERCQRAFERCLAQPGELITLIRSKLDKTGARHPSEWEFIAVTNQNGEVTEIQGVGQDISQRVEMEEQAAQAATRLENFIESVTDGFFIVDKDWRFIRTNPAFEELMHTGRHNIIGGVLWDVFPFFVNTEFESAYRKAAENLQTVHFSTYFTPLKKWLRSTIYASTDGLTVFIRDITTQRTTEEELNRARRNLESLINNIDDLIWSIDTSGCYIYTNNAFKNNLEKATGQRPADGQKVSYYGYPGAIAEQWKGYYARAFNGDRFDVVNNAIDPESGNDVYYEINFSPIFNDEGLIAGVGCFAHDITQRLEYENEIILQNERLKQIANLSSHELRRPVASMLGLLSLIDLNRFDNPENEQTIRYLVDVGKEIDKVIRLIVDNTFTDKLV
ncbi:PAS domain S-box protein [Mucilaginibacter terrenus]|uniref:histidine kinase n=1 Tax=Mucilaginibacter terrenus TaxID=2482727 RepID=A0A3E2NK93_9SPHI|nr:PAS domain S-box protein [Mucilaginibacter terrenus]RFZ81419.1 PAS domain S-box protein [Mucilaginibacter terrenus]